ncbi:MAG: tellurite resistance TerB family protein [Sporichthyaceae bacterium]|jgi:tellurite resistance protein TerB
MAMWNQLKQKSQDMSAQLKTKTGQLKNKNFSEASMAMCALIAAADGSIDAEERRKVAGLITSNDILSIFSPDDLRERFDHYCNKLSQDYDFGKVEALQALGKVKKKDVEARAVIQIGIIIGGADGNFDKDEMKAVKEACFAVGIDPAEFDL